MTTETEMEIVIGDVDQTITVVHEGGHSEPANFGGHPDSWTPDGSEDPEIISVLAFTGEDGEGEAVNVLADLDDATLEEITRKLWEEREAPWEPDC